MKHMYIFAVICMLSGCVTVPDGWEIASPTNVSAIADVAYTKIFSPDAELTDNLRILRDIAFSGKAEYRQSLIDFPGDKQQALRSGAYAMLRCGKYHGYNDFKSLCYFIKTELGVSGLDADAIFGLLLASMR